MVNRSSNTSFCSAGDVGGVLNGFDGSDELDAGDDTFCTLGSALSLFDEPDDWGRSSEGDKGGVWLLREICWSMLNDSVGPSKTAGSAKLSTLTSTGVSNGLEAVSKLMRVSKTSIYEKKAFTHLY